MSAPSEHDAEAAWWSDVGAAAQTARRSAGLTQQQLAEFLGLSRPSIANFERGAQRLTAYDLVRLAQLTSLTVPGLPSRAQSSAVKVLQEQRAELAAANRDLHARLRRVRDAVGYDGHPVRDGQAG